MAKKSKNSELLVHYARTMTPENLSRATNYVGGYVLKGLGALGKIFTAPLTGGPLGPATVVLPKTKELLDAERKLRETQEELIGKVMTWVSPLNYGAALATGNGLNARKGEEEVASWSPAWQAVGRLGELYVGPKGIKAVKSTPRAVVNTAAKAGSKTARAYLISKEIGKGKINLKELSNLFIEPYVTNPKGSGKVIHYDNGDAKSVFRNSGASIRDGKLVPGQTTRNLSNFTWWNKDNPYLNVHKSQGRFSPSRYITVDLTNLFVHPLKAGKSVGQSDGAGRGFILPTELVSETPVSLENALIWNKNPFGWWERVKSYQPKLLLEPSTSLKFFERRPAKISEAERAGVPKGERNQPFKEKQLTEHVQGDEAVKMFKEYGGEPIPEGSINGELLRKYVAEARERYGLKNNKNITDEEIAQALYKHSKELGGNTAAVNALGEPLLLFRGDTRRYAQLKERMSPEELAKKSGTMDNSLGNLFLGELPGTAGKRTRGLERYLVTGREFNENKVLEGSGTGSRAIMPDGTFASEWGKDVVEFPEGSYPLVTYNTKYGPNTYYKLPSSYSESGVNDINAFIVRTPQMRDASREISVLNDDFMIKGGPKVEYHGPIRREVLDKDGFPLIVDEKGNVVADGLAGSSDRQAMALHYRYVLNDAKNKKQGLLKSNGETDGTPGNYLRDEHDDYTYFALPNFNIQGAKHLLPYDLRKTRNWKDKNIYRGLIPLTTGYTLYNLFNQPLLQLQYLKQGGKMNILEFLKNGSGIHIKKKNRGLFTAYCHGKVTDECILKGKNSSNPAIRKRATFADNARHFKHKEGGLLKFEDGGKNGAPSTKFLSKLWFKNAGDNIGSFLNSDTGKGIMDIGLNILSGYTDYKKASNLLDSQVEQSKASLEKSYLDIMLEALQNKILRQLQLKLRWQLAYLNGETLDNYSDIVASHIGYNLYSSALLNAEQLRKLQETLIDLQAKLAKSNALGNLFGSVVLNGLGTLGNILGNKSSNVKVSTPNSSGLSNNNTTYTSPTTGITASVDDWKKAIQG